MSTVIVSLDENEPSLFQEITLISNEEKDGTKIEYKINKSNLSLSKMISTALHADKEETHINLSIEGQHLKLIVEYLNYYQDKTPVSIEKPLRSISLKELISQWEYGYVEQVYQSGNENFYKFMNAVNYVDIPSLVDLCCAKLAHVIKTTPLSNLENVLKIKE